MILKKINSIYKHFYSKYYISHNEHNYLEKAKYLFVNKTKQNNDTLLVVFSAFTGDVPRYNYFYSFKDLPVSQLYLLDNYGYKGSYYWLENGTNEPEVITMDIVLRIKEKYGFTNIITAGTSKGGTAAIYFGLELNAIHIFSGACQFFVGTYLDRDEHRVILEKMLGGPVRKENVLELDRKLENQIKKYRNSHGKIHLFYSKNELTYERQIVYLLASLKDNNYDFDETIDTFTDHSTVGTYFAPYLIKCIRNLKIESKEVN